MSRLLKRCCLCKEPQFLESFSRTCTAADGLARRCKACDAARYMKNRATILAKRIQYIKANREKVRAYAAAYKRKTPKQPANGYATNLSAGGAFTGGDVRQLLALPLIDGQSLVKENVRTIKHFLE